MGEQPQSPAQGSGGGILHRGEHSRMQGRAGQQLSSYMGASSGSCLSLGAADSWACRTSRVS